MDGVKWTANGKCPGPDGISGFWWKCLPALWGSLNVIFQSLLEHPEEMEEEEMKGNRFSSSRKEIPNMQGIIVPSPA